MVNLESPERISGGGVVNLESRARRLGSEWERHWTLAGRTQSPVATVWRLLTTAGDQGRKATILELRLIAKELDRAEDLMGDQVNRLLNLAEEVREFAEAVNDALADAEPAPVAPEWGSSTGIDDDVIDRMAAYYTQKGHRI